MTFSQIEKTREFLLRLQEVNGLSEMTPFATEIRSFYTGSSIRLEVFTNNTTDSYTIGREQKDKASIKSFLESQIAENDNNRKVLDILDLIDEGINSKGNSKQMAAFVSKVYYSYNDKIKFDTTTETAAISPSEVLSLGLVQVDENMVAGIINKLRNYGMSLLSQSSSAKSNPSVVINNSNTNSATASANADIKITIEQAKQQVEDAGFGDEQYKAVMDKLAEIESITNSQESKGGKWKKAKEILKWCTEQGIEIAKIILPLLPLMFNK